MPRRKTLQSAARQFAPDRQSGEVLTVDAGDGAHPLIPLGDGRFFMRLRYATMAFDGEAGRPASLLRWAEGGGRFPLQRLT